MKRAISLILAVILILSVTMLAGCGSENETSTDNHSSSHSTDESNDGNAENGDSESGSAVDNGSGAADGSGDGDAEASGEQSSASPAAETAKGEVADGLEVIAEEYHASEYLGVLLLIVKNNTGTVIQLKATADFYDESGELLNTDDDWEDDVAPGATVCLGGLLSRGDFTTSTYNVYYTVDEWSTHSVDQDLSMEYEFDNRKVTVSITNNGEYPASYVSFRAIFYKDGEITYEDSKGCYDDDNEIKPGATCTDEIEYNGDYDKGFDDVKVYFHGLASPEYFG
ncbi:MAG: hypothetical protein II425_05660 [Oscillospiraceae bacterium]|nr:hypothetical protein [Oscillospiraceae bacterium]MBQ3986214.1 hypothetical protein [Oscillospiraceae bacterium]MBQ5503736.1 hypothetical protein [Oscillospiraceae bacterium]MBQ5514588.1 hypothetical protein [Oscillospiraceae bacterium]